MGIEANGEGLIFLVSQPRAGSTLLQRILGCHPEIHTVGEPWLLLPSLYTLHPEHGDIGYDIGKASQALQLFLASFSEGERTYLGSMRKMYTYLYQRALEGSGKPHFLDKTPRYYAFLREIRQIFPEASLIVLLRNPLAVLNSIIRAWTRWSLLSLYHYRRDLLDAPRLLLQGMESLVPQPIVVRYEALVESPEATIHHICDELSLDFIPDMVDYAHQTTPKWEMGDQDGVYQHRRPVPDSVNRWTEGLTDPQLWRLSHDYLERLGQETIDHLGYDYVSLSQTLAAHRPTSVRLLATRSLAWYVKEAPEERSRWERGLAHLLQRSQPRSPAE
jgi:hypothetical protein